RVVLAGEHGRADRVERREQLGLDALERQRLRIPASGRGRGAGRAAGRPGEEHRGRQERHAAPQTAAGPLPGHASQPSALGWALSGWPSLCWPPFSERAFFSFLAASCSRRMRSFSSKSACTNDRPILRSSVSTRITRTSTFIRGLSTSSTLVTLPSESS